MNRVDSSNALGEYLRARREQVRPEDAGPDLSDPRLAELAAVESQVTG